LINILSLNLLSLNLLLLTLLCADRQREQARESSGGQPAAPRSASDY